MGFGVGCEVSCDEVHPVQVLILNPKLSNVWWRTLAGLLPILLAAAVLFV